MVFGNKQFRTYEFVSSRAYESARTYLAQRAKQGKFHKGHPCSEETKRKISMKLKGFKHSEEAKRKMKGRPSCWKGKHLPEEIRRKISATLKGRPLSEETKAKRWGRVDSVETRMKKSVSHKGIYVGNKWWNNGVVNVFSKTCPAGFYAGMKPRRG